MLGFIRSILKFFFFIFNESILSFLLMLINSILWFCVKTFKIALLKMGFYLLVFMINFDIKRF